MTEAEQAASDPRVGDKWEHPNGDTIEVVPPDDYRVKLLWSDGETWRSPQVQFEKHAAGWTLAERGPAPAAEKPERDPHTTPVVGDEWTLGKTGSTLDVDWFAGGYVNCVIHHDGQSPIEQKMTIGEFGAKMLNWTPIRRGDDPAWRPEGEKAEAVPEKKPVDYSHCGGIPWESVGKPAETSEQPAAGIKVGDRVRSISTGECGTVSEVSDYRAYAEFDSGYRDWMALHNWKTEWTIIPPAAAPEQDDTGDEPPASDRSSDGLTQSYQSDPVEEQHYRDSKYIRVIRSIGGKTAIEVDVYEVLEAFAVNCPATAHALKKILCAGIRGSKSRMQDLREARDSIMRAMEMQHQREAVAAAKGST